MLDLEELRELEDDIMAALPEKLLTALTMANRNGRLEELLELLKLSDLLKPRNKYTSYREGKIVVLGATEVKEKELLSIAKNLGVDKRRFEFCLDYNYIQKYDVRKLQYAPEYRVILCGPMPHSGKGKANSSSIITELENKEMYPRVERLISGNELKITKSNFREKLQGLINEEYI